jgi:serpin B
MRKLFVFLALCFLGFSAWAQSLDTQAAVDAVNGLSVDLYKKLASQEKGNLFFSPYSISDALAMTYAGARGETAQEMAKTLYFPAEQLSLHKSFFALNSNLEAIQKSGNVQINTANALWVQSDYNEGADYFKCKDEFLNLTKEYYKSELKQVDYRDTSKSAFIRDTINAWVEQKTNSKIKNLIPPDVPDQDTRLILVNAIYFKGKWQDEFEKKNTKPMPFYINAEEAKDVETMYQQKRFQYAEDSDVQVLTMPYKGYDLSMTIILPKDKNGLAAVENQLTAVKLSGWAKFWGRQEDTSVYLPKFRLESKFMLADTLKEMGMLLAFYKYNADFSGMADFPSNTHLYISKVIHKAFVDVYEEGTEAAAATAINMVEYGSYGLPPEPKVFRADHPFIFLIKDNKSGAILFLGRYVKPE